MSAVELTAGQPGAPDGPTVGPPELVTARVVGARRRRLPRPVRRLLGPLALIACWQAASSTGLVSADILASPVMVARAAAHLVADGELPAAMAASLRRVAVGLLFGGLAGVSLALVSSLTRLGEDLVDASVQMLRTVPFLGLIPLLIIWFGIGETPKIALVALGVAFPLYLNVFAAVRGVDVGLAEAGRAFGLSRLGLVRHVVLPAALPGALVGLRHALGVSWLALIFAEQVNASAGIGFLMNNAQEFQRTDVIVVCLLVYAGLGLLADLIVRSLERVLLSWRPAFSGR